jgi:mono/diheme cytochrome c family protein
LRNKKLWVTAGLVVGLLALPVQASFGAEGSSLFDKRCAVCHGKDGQADTPTGKSMHIKPWRTDAELKKMSDQAIRTVIVDGVKENGKVRMPPNKALTPEQLNDLIKTVHELMK